MAYNYLKKIAWTKFKSPLLQCENAKKWDAIVGNVTDLCGSAPQLIDELYKSESDTNFNNRAIAWLLKNYNRIYDDPDMSLDLYTLSLIHI